MVRLSGYRRSSDTHTPATHIVRNSTPESQADSNDDGDESANGTVDAAHRNNSASEIEGSPLDQQQDRHENGHLSSTHSDSDDVIDIQSTPLAGGKDPPHGPLSASRGKTRGRRRGRRPTARSGVSRQDITTDADQLSPDLATPKRRGGWRGRGSGGGRWANRRGGSQQLSQLPVDKDGNVVTILNDEVELAEDEEGETKVTKMGELLGGRQYRVRTFTVSSRGDRLYMLSTEPARCIGFRDSYLFFQKHKQLFKIIVDEEAKRDLIDRSIIPHSYKGRAIGIVTARSVFREFGARIVVGGRKVIDDYQVLEARSRGDVSGELAVPEDEVPVKISEYDRNRYVAWHGASSVYHTSSSVAPLVHGKVPEHKKRNVAITGCNWMSEHSSAASRFNQTLREQRRQCQDGVYDIHTNTVHQPRIFQPTHARWERAKDGLPEALYENTQQHKDVADDLSSASRSLNTIFPPIPDELTQKLMFTDIHFEHPLVSTSGYPGRDEAIIDIDPPGLSHVPGTVLDSLPTDCHAAYISALEKERRWKTRWDCESSDHARSKLTITYSN